jgi:hypothetical protein
LATVVPAAGLTLAASFFAVSFLAGSSLVGSGSRASAGAASRTAAYIQFFIASFVSSGLRAVMASAWMGSRMRPPSAP